MSTRDNADEAFAAFMGMGDSEWHGLLRSLAGGGCLETEEHKGFLRAHKERAKFPSDVKQFDYSDEQEAPTVDALAVVRTLVAQMNEAERQVDDLEEKLKQASAHLREYRENLVPTAMLDVGLTSVTTADGFAVELREEVRASFPSGDSEESALKRAMAFEWLRENGHSALVKNSISIRFSKDEQSWAESFYAALDRLGVRQHAEVERQETIHSSTLVSFVKEQLAQGSSIPLQAFGAFTQRFARIKKQRRAERK